MNKIKSYILHYILGLLASCWNAGILAIRAAFGQCVGSDISSKVPLPTGHVVLAVFVGATIIEAVTYFAQHPIPVSEIPDIAAPSLAPKAAVAVIPAV